MTSAKRRALGRYSLSTICPTFCITISASGRPLHIRPPGSPIAEARPILARYPAEIVAEYGAVRLETVSSRH